MKLTNLFLVISISTFLFNCNNNDDDNEAKVNPPILNFEAVYNDKPLIILDESYDYEENMNIRVQLFQFFITDVRLIDESGEATDPILDVALVNFSNNFTEEAAEAGVNVELGEIAPGKYTGVKFGIGVNPDLNGTAPEDYTPGHPLSEHYWRPASSYVFAKVEGNADLTNTDDYSTKFTFHIGGNPRYREVQFNKDIEVEVDGALPIRFEVDLKDVLVDDLGQFVNFNEVTIIHDGTAETAVFMMDNLSSAIRLK